MSAESAIGAFETGREAFVQDLLTLLRFETVSTDPDRTGTLRECAEWLCGQMVAAGLEAQIMPTDGGHPVVFGDTGPVAGRPDAPTVLMYGHYDVQPPGDPALWTSPPFEPTLRDGALYARGASDDKGQMLTHLVALRCWKEAGGPLPVRVKCLIEGEEEIGSPHLPAFVEAHRDLLACDLVLISDTSKHDEQTPALGYSTRGLVYKEIRIDGPSRDLHSGQYGGAVANPANVLARIVASLHDERGRVSIPGFYDDVAVLGGDERRRLAEHGMSDDELRARTGSPGPMGEEGFTATERTTARPTLDVNGMISGFTGAGAATIIPAWASAKVSMRLVANQDAGRIAAAFDEAVRAACPEAVRLTIRDHAHCDPYAAPADSPAMRAAMRALADGYGREPVLLREGGTLPILPMFKRVLGADSVLMGFADPNCNLHSPNEFFRLRDFETGTRCVLRFLELVGHQKRS